MVDFSLTEEQKLLRQTVREFAAAELTPHAREWDEKQEFPPEVFDKLGEMGLLGVVFPTEYGGAGLGALDYALVMEELARAEAGVALSVAAHHSLCSGHIYLAGSEDQKQRLLVPLAQGDKVGCWGLTESSAGSDAGGTKTTAVRDGEHWVLNGSKQFITNGGVADIAVVMAVTDRSKAKKGISAFVVERGTPGLAIAPQPAMGLRAAATCRVTLRDVRVADDAMLEHDHGALVDGARVAWCALAVGTGQAVLDHVISYCNERVAFGEPISHRQAVAFAIANLAIELEAMRLLTWRAAAVAERGAPFAHEAALARRFCATRAVQLGNDGVQLLGGHGFVKEHPVERWYRDLRAVGVMEGALLA